MVKIHTKLIAALRNYIFSKSRFKNYTGFYFLDAVICYKNVIKSMLQSTISNLMSQSYSCNEAAKKLTIHKQQEHPNIVSNFLNLF